ncbi:prepilin peptidase [Brevibacillus invocatus]|uniref:Prepilin peptidase n=1 Tax=Brevibacillus invocatus TaxID=173959 RepID=A0A3M8BZG3_9BACL|nr:A24 family peptidase [Brevibacillus invocatus]RNB68806.1 prepilin peptidase [Brevibacillus invocatus]
MNEWIVLAMLLVAAWSDLRRRKIPNMCTVPMMVTGLGYQCLNGMGWLALTGLTCGFLLTVVPVLIKGMGMGDQKLLMAVGAWSSWSDIYLMFLMAILLCLVAAVLLPSTWTLLYTNLRAILVGWTAHRQLWLPMAGRSALSFPFAVWLLAAYLLQPIWYVVETGI